MHEGHRDRMRERILLSGIESLQPHEVLEYLLYHAIPRKDTNGIAHELISKFGSFNGVLNADYDALLEVNGMTANAALLLTSLKGVFRMYASGDKKGKIVIATRGDLVRYLSPFFYGEKTEKFYMLCLDAKNTVIKLVKLSSGIPQEVRVDVRDVVDNALKYKAVSVVVAHNHPSGDVSPSVQDVELTRAIAAALQLIKIKLADHYIFSDFGYCSFVEDGVGGQIQQNVNNFLKDGIKY